MLPFLLSQPSHHQRCTLNNSNSNPIFSQTISNSFTICWESALLFYSFPSLPVTLSFARLTTLLKETLKNHGDITNPCLNPLLTSKYSLTLFPHLTHALLPSYSLFSPQPSNLQFHSCHVIPPKVSLCIFCHTPSPSP